MERVYFTFGSWEKYPHHNTYMIVEAESFNAAIAEFRKKYPDVHENCLNCADYYREQAWRNGVSDYYKGVEPAEIIRSEFAEILCRTRVLLENAMKIAMDEASDKYNEYTEQWLLEEMGTTKDELKELGIDAEEVFLNDTVF